MPAELTASSATASALDWVRRTLDIETQALQAVRDRVGEPYARAVALMLACTGRIVVIGMGKSGHVGKKVAATLASTGTPAFFVHPAEAAHGDLGMITAQDVALVLSNSGESNEISLLLPALHRLEVPVVALTGGGNSSLARHAAVVLDTGVAQEACPLGLAPTASTTVQMAVGDALAVALLDARGFAADDFARSHPAGSLGRRLLVLVRDVMRTGDDLPQVGLDAPLVEVLREMSAKRLGLSAVVDASGRVQGVFTDGDLRRLLERGDGAGWSSLRAGEVMRPGPRSVSAQALAADAAALMERHSISALLVLDNDGRLQGVLGHHDLMQAKVI
ncbi:KpsF/GutQ family sugar-phosphate isomerase [Amphibiibacter pelophylacis]|uniref:KpsF/GutQ family sugar-phosphate isomerase n=1 Tax=Amphibiibacter pelophylacis TaxID=1799477 RepID=A0ACC6NZ76_9BURK